jgi:cyclic beta-1,2-glucan synthetase
MQGYMAMSRVPIPIPGPSLMCTRIFFGEGSFIGKGIYDLDAFERALNNRFPDNRILSHDLLEGCYARAGLVSDVQLYEEYPSSYQADARRRHRWIRGDWQIAQWITSILYRALTINFIATRYQALSTWKIFDNLRRTLVPQALLILLLYGWLYSANSLVLDHGRIMIKLLACRGGSWLGPVPQTKRCIVRAACDLFCAGSHQQFYPICLDFIFLPYEALMNIDAIFAQDGACSSAGGNYWNGIPSVTRTTMRTSEELIYPCGSYRHSRCRLFIFIYVTLTTLRLFSALPVLALWLLAPFISWWISLPMEKPRADLSYADLGFLS